jgi:hypothetical protein
MCAYCSLLAGEGGELATMPASDPAREVHLGIKTGAFYGQDARWVRASGAGWFIFLCKKRVFGLSRSA